MLAAFDLDGTLHCQDSGNDATSLGELAIALRDQRTFTVLVTGRSLDEVMELQQIMSCLVVDAIIANSGTQVYFRQAESFVLDSAYAARAGASIPESDREIISGLFLSISAVTLQEKRHQFPGKLAFYVKTEGLLPLRALLMKVKVRYPFYEYLISYNPVERGYHYIDVHSKGCTKLAGLRFVAASVGVAEENILYFGDNGNDLPCFMALSRTAVIETYMDQLYWDAAGFDWASVMRLKRGGGASILQAFREMTR